MHTEGQRDSNIPCYRIGNERDRHLMLQAIKRRRSRSFTVFRLPRLMLPGAMKCDTIIVKCAGKTFIHLILSDSNDDAPQFLSINEDPVVVTLTDEERQQLERAE